ncbi:MAG: RluA family pseudouridine synthase [Fimbriiglobus sp.]
MLAVLYEDHHLIAVNKPAPLLTQAPEGVPNLEALVKAYLKDKYAKPGGVYLGVPHRLDRPVTGVILFCRNTKCTQKIQAQFEARTIEKLYLATVAGIVLNDEGIWESHLRKVPDEARVEPCQPTDPGAKLARTRFRVLARRETECDLELEPLTGRMHQLRAQAAWHGHPIHGDELYGSTTPHGPPADLPRDRTIALHAHRLTLTHPFSKTPLTIECPKPS